MSKIHTLSLSSIAAVTAMALMAPLAALAPDTAHAQSGSRLCGWVADTPAGAIGVLYEARQKDASYNKQCSTVIEKAEKKIQTMPAPEGFPPGMKMSDLKWNRVSKATCESVGKGFRSDTHGNEDMCDYMQAKTPFIVVKSAVPQKGSSTTYTKVEM